MRIGRIVRAFAIVAVAVAVPSAARPAAVEEIDRLGDVPVDCSVLKRDYTDPTCLAQTRNGTFSLSPHIVHAGKTLTGTIGNRCIIGYGNDAPCPIDWNEMAPVGKRVSGCGKDNVSCTVRIPKLAPTSNWKIVTVGITSAQGTGISKDYFAVIGKGKFVLAGHVKNERLEPVRNVKVLITGPGVREQRKTDRTGFYSALLKAGRYVVTANRDGLKPVKSRDCRVVAKTCRIYLIQDRTADFEVHAPALLFKARLGAKVRSPERPSLIKAGTPFLVNVTLRNTSRDDRLLVWPIYGKLSGNASDGHLQPAGMPVRRFTPDGAIDEVRPSPYVLLQPKQTRTFNVVVRTTASDAFAEVGESAAGGTRATVTFSPPKLARIDKDDNLSTLDPKDLELLDPRKAVQMEEGSSEFTVRIDDSAPAPPAFSSLQATFYVTKGLVIGLWNVTWGTVRGLLWDLPTLALQELARVQSRALAYVQYEVELWESIKDDPVLVAAFLNPLTNQVLIAFKEAPFLVGKTEELAAQINRSISVKYNKMARDWYAGDWRNALTAMTVEGTEQLGNVALALAPGTLARVPAAQQAWVAAKTAVYARVAEGLAPLIKPTTTAAEALRAFNQVLKPGFLLDDLHLQKLYGISAAQAKWLRAYARSMKLLLTFRSRAQQSLKWIERGARLKPSWIKIKTVNWNDVKYLGYQEADFSRLVIRKPPSRVEFYKEIFPKIPVSERAEAAKHWFLRSQEYGLDQPGYVREMFRWNTKKEVKGKWPWSENLMDPAVQVDEVTTTGFRLTKRPGRPSERLVEVENPPGSGKWVSVTGDVDFLSITKANGQPLTDAEHVRALKDLRAGPVGAEHGDTATWKAPESVRAKYLGGKKCCPAQIGADGKARAVRYNRDLSFFKNPEKYRVWWDGGYLLP